jgi:hypothetical protein
MKEAEPPAKTRFQRVKIRKSAVTSTDLTNLSVGNGLKSPIIMNKLKEVHGHHLRYQTNNIRSASLSISTTPA